MATILEKLKLVQHFEAELRMTPEEFRTQMNEKIDREPPGFFSDSFDAWRSHKNDFKGLVEQDTIVFKHRNKMFNQVLSIPMIHVSFLPQGKNLAVKTTINAFTGVFMVLQIVGFVGFFAILFAMLTQGIRNEAELTYVIAPIVAALFFIIIPYIAMRWSLNQVKKKINEKLYPLDSKSSF